MDMDNQAPSFDANATPAPAPAPEPAREAPSERTFRQHEVNDIVKRVKHDAVEDYKRLSSQQPQYAQQKYGDASYQQAPYQTMSSGVPESEIRRLAAEEAQKLRDNWTQEAQSKAEADAAQRVVNNFWNKIAAGKEKYQDFEQVTGNIELARFPNVVQLLADHVENSHDVLYELGKNRMKMAQLEQLSYMSPKDAIFEAQRLADSIKANETAGNLRVPNPPLSQLRPSTVGTDSGALSMADLKRKYRG